MSPQNTSQRKHSW